MPNTEAKLKRSIDTLSDLCAAAAGERQPQRPRLDTASPAGRHESLFARESPMEAPVSGSGDEHYEGSGHRILSWTGFMTAAHAGERQVSATNATSVSPQTLDGEPEQSSLLGFSVFPSRYEEFHWDPRSIFAGHNLDSFLQELPLSLSPDADRFELHLRGPGVKISLDVCMYDVEGFESVKGFINSHLCSAAGSGGDPKYVLTIKERRGDDSHHATSQPLQLPDSPLPVRRLLPQRFVPHVRQKQAPSYSQDQRDLPCPELWPGCESNAYPPLPTRDGIEL